MKTCFFCCTARVSDHDYLTLRGRLGPSICEVLNEDTQSSKTGEDDHLLRKSEHVANKMNQRRRQREDIGHFLCSWFFLRTTKS